MRGYPTAVRMLHLPQLVCASDSYTLAFKRNDCPYTRIIQKRVSWWTHGKLLRWTSGTSAMGHIEFMLQISLCCNQYDGKSLWITFNSQSVFRQQHGFMHHSMTEDGFGQQSFIEVDWLDLMLLRSHLQIVDVTTMLGTYDFVTRFFIIVLCSFITWTSVRLHSHHFF